MDTLHTIRSLAATQFGGDADAIDIDVPVNQLGIDSLGLLEFLFELEDSFAVSIPPQAMPDIPTLREVAAILFELEDSFAVSIPPQAMPDIPTLREVAATVDMMLAARAQQPT